MPRSNAVSDLRKAVSEMIPDIAPKELGVNIHVGTTRVFMRAPQVWPLQTDLFLWCALANAVLSFLSSSALQKAALEQRREVKLGLLLRRFQARTLFKSPLL
jgi:hypothetical protein